MLRLAEKRDLDPSTYSQGTMLQTLIHPGHSARFTSGRPYSYQYESDEKGSKTADGGLDDAAMYIQKSMDMD